MNSVDNSFGASDFTSQALDLLEMLDDREGLIKPMEQLAPPLIPR